MESIDLSDFLAALRRELSEAIRDGRGAGLHFIANAIDVELEVVAEAKQDGSGKVSFKVFGTGFDAGGAVSSGSRATQRLKISLGLVDADGRQPLISAQASNSDL